ncbi:MAG TPA: DUF1583 domain-containing protein [Gemmataceae bacterium]
MKSLLDHYLPRLVLALCCAVCASPGATAEEFVQNFQGRPYDTRYFRPTGTNTHRVLRADPGGLRISLLNADSRMPVGLVCGLGVHGDFEITMWFEILRLVKSPGGRDAGLSIYVSTASLTQDAASLARSIHSKGEEGFICHRATTPRGEERQHHVERFPTTAYSGSLRLVRKGTALSYHVAEGGSNTFQELYQTDWASEDLDTVRFAADNGGSPSMVDALIRAVSIRADEFGPARPAPQPFRWTTGMTTALTVLLLATGSLWLWLRWRRSSYR